jgi:predicted solute-binding protein
MSTQRTRVACVGYTNAWPLTRHLDRNTFDVIPCVPSAAARMLARREVDVGLVPIGSLFDAGMSVCIVPGLAIACDGDVASVLLVGERPIEEWTEVVLDGESRTSVILAQVLLRGPLKRADLTVRPVDPGTGAFHAQGTVGAVIIGDAARNVPERLSVRIDLGRVWTDWTGLPFVFAVWAGRPDLAPGVIEGLRRAAERGLPEREYASAEDRRYLTEHVRYALDDRAMMGLRRFVALAQGEGLLGEGELSLYPPETTYAERPLVEAMLDRAVAGEALNAGEWTRLNQLARTPALVAAAKALLGQRGSNEVALNVGVLRGAGRTVVAAGGEFGVDRADSAIGLVRRVALARLAAGKAGTVVVHVPESAGDHGLGVVQAALDAGADEIGEVAQERLADVAHWVRVTGRVPLLIGADGSRSPLSAPAGRYAWAEGRPGA